MSNAAVCDACGAIQASGVGASPFELLGFRAGYSLDEAVLGSAFRAITRKIHPDRFAAAEHTTRDLAARLCAEVNHAYQVLADPVRRADLLLVSAGGPTSSDLREVPGNLLAQTMILREEIETAKGSNDAAALDRLRGDVAARRRETLLQIADATERLSVLGETDKAELRRQLNAMKYHDNLLTELTLDPLDQPT